VSPQVPQKGRPVAVESTEESGFPALPPGVVVVAMPAEVDLATAPAVRDELLSTLNRDGVHLVVDARGVEFMDSSGVNALVRARERATALDGSLHVVTASRAVRRVLEITALEDRVGLVTTMDEAIACVAAPGPGHTCRRGRLTG